MCPAPFFSTDSAAQKTADSPEAACGAGVVEGGGGRSMMMMMMMMMMITIIKHRPSYCTRQEMGAKCD